MATKRTASKPVKRTATSGSRERTSAKSTKGAVTGSADELAASHAKEVDDFAAEFDFDSSNSRVLRSYLTAPTASRTGTTYPDLRDEYANLWAEMSIRTEKIPEIDAIVNRIMDHATAYRSVELATGVPWYVTALIHNMEASGDFNCHLHNGDPLSGRTVHVPAGRPEAGEPPFSWEDSAADALKYDGLANQTDWSVEGVAYAMEKFNGWGYRLYHPHVKSPYLWSFSNQYTSGKYVGDGQWSDSAVSGQCGAMVLLRRLQELGHVRLDYAVPDVPTARTIRTRDSAVAVSQPRRRARGLAVKGDEIILPYDHDRAH
jgi:lysozyme family protein